MSEARSARHGVIFDLDGVLVDSEPVHLAAYQEVLAGHGVRLAAEDYFARYVAYSDREVLEALLPAARVDTALAAKAARYLELAAAGLPAFPDGLALVRRAAPFALALATGSSRAEAALALRGLGIADRFSAVVAREDCARCKPDPEPYRRAAACLGLPAARCVAIEDSPGGVQAAKAAGLRCVAVRHWCTAERLREADVVVETLDAVDLGRVFGLRGCHVG